MTLAPYRGEDYYYHPWNVHRGIIPRSPKTWQDDFGYVLHPLRNIERTLEHTSDSAPIVDEHGFHVCVDVHQFMPCEISLKTRDQFIVVGGKHEEREDEHGSIMRQFERRFELPKGYDHENVTSELSADGILTIRAPKPMELEENERQIHIKHTGLHGIYDDDIRPTLEHIIKRVKSFEF